MRRLLMIVTLLVSFLNGNAITPSEVFGQVKHIEFEVESMLKYYGIQHDHEKIKKRVTVKTNLKPRNVWQKSYEIMIKINLLRTSNKLPIIEPINMSPVLNLNPDLVYEQTQRILTELKIFRFRLGIDIPSWHVKMPICVQCCR